MEKNIIIIGEKKSDKCKIFDLFLDNYTEKNTITTYNLFIESDIEYNIIDITIEENNIPINKLNKPINHIIFVLNALKAFNKNSWDLIKNIYENYGNFTLVLSKTEKLKKNDLMVIKDKIVELISEFNLEGVCLKKIIDNINSIEKLKQFLLNLELSDNMSNKSISLINNKKINIVEKIDDYIDSDEKNIFYLKMIRENYTLSVEDQFENIRNSKFIIKKFKNDTGAKKWLDSLLLRFKKEELKIYNQVVESILEEKDIEIDRIRKKMIKKGIISNKEWYKIFKNENLNFNTKMMNIQSDQNKNKKHLCDLLKIVEPINNKIEMSNNFKLVFSKQLENYYNKFKNKHVVIKLIFLFIILNTLANFANGIINIYAKASIKPLMESELTGSNGNGLFSVIIDEGFDLISFPDLISFSPIFFIKGILICFGLFLIMILIISVIKFVINKMKITNDIKLLYPKINEEFIENKEKFISDKENELKEKIKSSKKNYLIFYKKKLEEFIMSE